MQKNDRLQVTEVLGYVQGKEPVKRFLQGCYDIKVEVITGGEHIARYNLSLIISKDTWFNFHKKKFKAKIIGTWKQIKNGG